jgi:NADP-reducing hydrogenase subunit HndB
MPRLNSYNELLSHGDHVKQLLQARTTEETTITVGTGTCGLAAGAEDTIRTIHSELAKRNLSATIRTVGCIGMCINEPLVDIQLPGGPRVTYIKVHPAQVPRLIDEHIANGRIVHDLAIGIVPPDW